LLPAADEERIAIRHQISTITNLVTELYRHLPRQLAPQPYTRPNLPSYLKNIFILGYYGHASEKSGLILLGTTFAVTSQHVMAVYRL
jgi:hypothetical protein